jgi:F0F1-type ATP synthase membrane subunit b/b'
MVAAAEAKLKEYQERVSAARLLAKQDLDSELKKAHQKEAELFAHAREEAKRITQEAMVGIQRERQNLQQQLSKDVEVFANQITEKLVGAKK